MVLPINESSVKEGTTTPGLLLYIQVILQIQSPVHSHELGTQRSNTSWVRTDKTDNRERYIKTWGIEIIRDYAYQRLCIECRDYAFYAPLPKK